MKYSKPIFLLAFLLVLAAMVLVYIQHRMSRPEATKPQISHLPAPRDALQIRGFHFDGHFDGKKVLSIKAEKFTIEKKKLGPFSLGLFHVANFRDAVIDIYGRPGTFAGIPEEDSLEKSSEGKGRSPGGARPVTFRDVFKKEALPFLPTKRVASVIMEPVCLNLYDERALVTRITASSATIRMKNRDVLFEGNVRVITGKRRLRTDQLSLLPETAMLRVEKHFTLETPEKRLDGENLSTDIYLSVK